MSLHRTVTATCDADVVDKGLPVPCESTLDLNPNDPQVWLAVTAAGWVVDHLGPLTPDGDLRTYCPSHAKGVL